VNVELEAVRAAGHPGVEGGDRIFWSQGASTAMGEDTGARPIEETHAGFIL
jgi:hypothetical protein